MTDLRFHQFDKAEGVARITLARPKHNVLDLEMMDELHALLEDVLADRDLKCVVFLGDGPSWCAGVEVSDHKPEKAPAMIRSFNRLFEDIHRIEVPTVAAVHGTCLGGGMELAIACDIVVASPRAVFGQPEIKLGFLPPYAAIRLPELVGPARAVEICCTGRRYAAEHALRIGFVSQVTGEADFAEQVEKLVGEIKDCSPLVLRLNKRAIARHRGLKFADALSGVGAMFLDELMKTEDTLEGIASFEGKRRPVWKNR